MFNKNINNLFLTTLIIVTLIVFSKNFYNEILLKFLNNPNFFKVFFSDFYLIFAGADILNNGNNPYKEWINIHNSPFFNPPIVFNLFKFIANYEYLIIVKFWFFILILSFIFIPLILFKIFKINYKLSFIFLICFGGISLSVFLTGNLSILLTLLFALSLFFLNKKKDHIFYIILSFLSIIKFPYLIFFGIPFLLKDLNKKLLLNTILYLSIIILIYLISFYLNNELFISWINSIEYSKNIGDQGDFGRGLFRILDSYIFSNNYYKYTFYFAISGFIFIFLVFLSKKSKILNDKKNKNLLLAFSIISLSMLLPRLKSYDVLITIPCLFFLIDFIKFKTSEKINSFIKFLLFLFLFCITSPYAPISLCFIIFFDCMYSFSSCWMPIQFNESII